MILCGDGHKKNKKTKYTMMIMIMMCGFFLYILFVDRIEVARVHKIPEI